MAELVRKSEDLLTIRLRSDMSDRGLQLTAEPLRGHSPLGEPVRMSLRHLGYSEDRRDKASSSMNFPEGGVLPPRLEALFREVARQARGDEALWLQIEYGSEILAAYPWEKQLSKKFGQAIFRIPNFARNTYREPAETDPIVFCAGTPRAKQAPEWKSALIGILGELETQQPVVLYLGKDDRWNCSDFDFPHLNIRIADLPSTSDAPEQETYISTREAISNPWLRWIILDQGRASSSSVHAIHFLCTGYAQDCNGALALPETPHFDTDSSWARFVGVPEFTAFADRLNCQISGFTALGSERWREGLRLFANELSWKRPGPLFVDFRGSHSALVYNSLLHGKVLSTDAAPELTLSVHPKAISADEMTIPVTRSFAQDSRQADFSAELTYLQSYPRQPSDVELPTEVQRVMGRLSSAKPKSVLRSAHDRGTLRAMEFLTTLTIDRATNHDNDGLDALLEDIDDSAGPETGNYGFDEGEAK
jgi:hypothetical protein